MGDDPRSFEHEQYPNNPQEYPTNSPSRPYPDVYQPAPPHQSIPHHSSAPAGNQQQQHRPLAQNAQQQSQVVHQQSDHQSLHTMVPNIQCTLIMSPAMRRPNQVSRTTFR
ncbi:uncharacterized protein EI90DRAFT_1184998 [Cantharellus anzutake]|uniref:uncharacterized protein n=1 Tax=Cantharellus anzutake TaxID=1750568 RepID=UPI001907102A|nr:uncharacterized protein EI90DRAFT_1184998 [Cantharellus anzutake]KAF8330373.1 hypothetical protein EI90DRAFT_1184998 [Cantharellus anzutake]